MQNRVVAIVLADCAIAPEYQGLGHPFGIQWRQCLTPDHQIRNAHLVDGFFFDHFAGQSRE